MNTLASTPPRISAFRAASLAKPRLRFSKLPLRAVHDSLKLIDRRASSFVVFYLGDA